MYVVNAHRLPWRAWIVLLVGGPGCTDALSPDLTYSLEPPRLYRLWWNEVEACAQANGNFNEIMWYLGQPTAEDGEPLVGAWRAPGVIVLRPFYSTSEPAVKHEMVHHLTGGSIPHYHPAFRDCTRPRGDPVRIALGP